MLAEQKGTGGLFGMIAIEKGYIDDATLGRYIEAHEVWSRLDAKDEDERPDRFQ